MEIRIATNPARLQREDIEGPTPAQARRMAARRLSLMADAREALEAGDNDRAFDRDAEAFDIECDLRRYGRNPQTGRALARR